MMQKTTEKKSNNTMTLFAYYQQQCDLGLICVDQEQLLALLSLQKIYDELVASTKKCYYIFSFLRKPTPIKGAYLFGDVGIGKTFLLDCFYEYLPVKEKKRFHFHAFMQMIHQSLKKYHSTKNPLAIIAKEISKNYRVLCLDEFIVTDIVDAMLLAKLLQALFEEGVCLVTTSNTSPDNLYKDGLQRISFLPAIRLLKQFTSPIHLSTKNDYRAKSNNKNNFQNVSHKKIESLIEQKFSALTLNDYVNQLTIHINDRWIPVIKSANTIIWFDFSIICAPPRNQHDYLELTKRYRTFCISNIPLISPNAKDRLALFIKFIDVLYDAKVTLFFSTTVPFLQLLDSRHFPSEYARTCSRLLEMSLAIHK